MADKRDPKRDQPLPEPGELNVQQVLSKAVLERMQYGIDKYGSPLETFNGRDPIRDVWEELLDALTYMTQIRLERGDRLPGMDPADRVTTSDLTLPVVRCNTCGGVRSMSAYDAAERLQRQGWILQAVHRLAEGASPMVRVDLLRKVLDGDLKAAMYRFVPESDGEAYNKVQDLIEGDGPTQDRASAWLKRNRPDAAE